MIYINREKLKKVKLNKENFYVAIDFDRTITASESLDSWDAAGKTLGEEFNRKTFELYAKYRPIELDYKISFEEKNKAMEDWYRECVDLYYEYHLTRNKLQESIEKSNLIFRKGAKEFLKYMYENKIPVIILSAGIGNVIEQVLQKNNCLYENILIISNFLKFDKEGNMKKFDGELVHNMNKTMKGHLTQEALDTLDKKEYRLMLGDTIEDKKMVFNSEWEKTIFVGFLNEKIEDNFEVYKQNYDIVLTKEDGNFDVLFTIL